MEPILSNRQPQNRFEFIGGAACLDFTNTVGGIRSGVSREDLTNYADLVHWSLQAGLLSEREAEILLHKAELDDRESATVLERARTLREAIYRIFTALLDET